MAWVGWEKDCGGVIKVSSCILLCGMMLMIILHVHLRNLSGTNKDFKPHLWQNRILKQHSGATIVHSAGVFSQPKKDKGQHYSLHPEWPTA